MSMLPPMPPMIDDVTAALDTGAAQASTDGQGGGNAFAQVLQLVSSPDSTATAELAATDALETDVADALDAGAVPAEVAAAAVQASIVVANLAVGAPALA